MTDTYSPQPQTVPGLLSPDQYSNPTSQGLAALGAGLIKAGGPSETRGNFSGVGDAINGGLAAYQKATTQALQNQYLKGQISQQTFGQLMTTMQTIGQLHWAGMPIPPALQTIARDAGVSLPEGATLAPAPSQGGPAPAPQASAAPGRVPGLLSLPDTPAPVGPAPSGPPPGLLSPAASAGSIVGAPGENIIGGGAGPAGPPPGLLSPAPMPFNARVPSNGGMSSGPSPSISGVLDNLPARDRQGMIFGGPAAKVITDVVSKNAEQTPAGKDARDPAVLRYDNAKEQGKADVKQYSDLHKGLSGAGYTAANSQPYVDAAKGLLNDPGFYSGSGEGLNLGYKRFLAAAGIEPGAALPQEAFRKVMAANILQQVNSLKAEAEAMGQNGGRIFSSQIELMEKAAQNPDNSIAANRYLTEVAARSAARTQKIADLADDYKTANGALDAGFEKGMREYLTKNPMFTAKELANPSLVGKPDAAPASAPTHFATNPKTGQRMGLVNNQLVPVDAKGTPIPSVGASR